MNSTIISEVRQSKWYSEYQVNVKPQEELFNILIYRPLGFPCVKLCAFLHITPNFITFIAILCAFASAIFFGIGNIYWGAFFLFLSHYFDCVDGALARVTNNFSKYGALFDAIGDGIGSLAVIVAIAIEQYIRLNQPIIFLFLALTFISNFLGLIYHSSVKSRYFKHLRAGIIDEKLSSKTKYSSLVNAFGYDSESEAKVKFLETYMSKISPFPDIQKDLYIKNSKEPLSLLEKQTLFKKRLSFLPLLWSLTSGASIITCIIIIALFNRLDDVFWWILIVGWNLLPLPLSLIHFATIHKFNKNISEHPSRLNEKLE